MNDSILDHWGANSTIAIPPAQHLMISRDERIPENAVLRTYPGRGGPIGYTEDGNRAPPLKPSPSIKLASDTSAAVAAVSISSYQSSEMVPPTVRLGNSVPAWVVGGYICRGGFSAIGLDRLSTSCFCKKTLCCSRTASSLKPNDPAIWALICLFRFSGSERPRDVLQSSERLCIGADLPSFD